MIKPELRPWFPVKWDQHLRAVYALKALQVGEATKEQQQEALDFILLRICKMHDLSFYPDSPRDGDFAEGKRYVGNQIVKLMELTGEQLDDARQAQTKPKK